MSTGTVESLTMHVPVDRVWIARGPRDVNWLAVMERLNRSTTARPVRERLLFTLKTAASRDTFMRHIKLATIFSVEDDEFTFTAIFCGRVVSGIYNTKTQKGWFNLD